jgi:glycogen debranching enzyme
VLGASNSAYSLAGQLRLNPTFSPAEGPAASMEDVEALMERLREEYGMLSICDIVLNHTANETPWLAGWLK